MSFFSVPKWLKRNHEGIVLPQFYSERLQDFDIQRGDAGASLITGLRGAWREDFSGVALNPAVWTVVQIGAGQTITVAASELRIATGVEPNSETIIRSVQSFRVPLRKQVIFMLSQRIANQEFFIEMVNASGDMFARWMYDGGDWRASVTTGNANYASATRALSGTSSSVMGCQITEMLLSTVNFHQRAVDSFLISAAGIRQDRLIPDPNQEYFVQIRVRNLAVAPVSTTTLTVDAISVEDATLINAEIVQGFSSGTPAQSIPVNVLLGSIGTQSINTAFIDTATPLGANAVFNGTTRDFSTTHRINGVRAMSVSDQPGTLFVYHSEDAAVNTWAVIAQPTASVTDADGIVHHMAVISTPTYARRARVRYRNGATASNRLRINSLLGGV